MFGMDVSVSLQRPGWRVARRAVRTRPIPSHHRVTREDGIHFMKEQFGIEVVS